MPDLLLPNEEAPEHTFELDLEVLGKDSVFDRDLSSSSADSNKHSNTSSWPAPS